MCVSIEIWGVDGCSLPFVRGEDVASLGEKPYMFSKPRFRQHCDILSGPALRKTAGICIALGFVDSRLLASYRSFVLLMLTVHYLVPLESKAELRSAAAAWPKLHLAILAHGPLASDIPPLLDLCAGVRAQHASNMFAKL